MIKDKNTLLEIFVRLNHIENKINDLDLQQKENIQRLEKWFKVILNKEVKYIEELKDALKVKYGK